MSHVTMDPNYAHNTWKLLKGAIKEIHKQNASGLSFEELYRNAYNMVLHKYGDMLYNGLKDVVDDHLASVAQCVVKAADDSFLAELNSAWSNHKVSMLMVRDILMYLDRVYVPHKGGECEAVYDLGLALFRKNVTSQPKIKERLLKTLLHHIQSERHGEVIDRGRIRNVTQMLVDVGLQSNAVYVSDFEESFLRATAVFYREEGQTFLANASCPEYLRKVETRLKEEVNRVAHYLDSSSKPKLAAVLEEELLSAHLSTLVNHETGLLTMLREDQIDDLKRMYSLLGRVEGGHQSMLNLLNEYISESGTQCITEYEDRASVKKKRKKDAASRETYVSALLVLKQKFNRLLLEAFRGDTVFQRTMNQAFEAVVNSNSRSPEFISMYIDQQLKHGLRGLMEDEAESVMGKVMELFRFLSEKDVFERYYKQHLARRLLTGKSISDYAEKQMLTQLKAECGYQFTSKLEGMFQDIRVSSDTEAAFNRYVEERNIPHSLELSVQVLTTGFWPVAQVTQACSLPEEVAKYSAVYTEYYLSRHSGRRLTWQTSMGNAELKCIFPGGKRHTLNVSTYQMTLLMLFNSSASLSFAEIAAHTNIEESELQRHLLSLLRFRVLVKDPVEPKRVISSGDMFTVNPNFKSKLHRLKIALGGATRDSSKQREVTNHKVSEDRRLAIQAAVIRIMKSRKTLSHVSLVNEVTSQLNSRFPPDPLVVKKQIESLIEREYLQRSSSDRRTYEYLA